MQRQYRLSSNGQFNYVYRRGRRFSTKDLTLLYISNRQKQVGFSVSKKVGVAVVRNRTKRRLRECVRALLPEMKNGYYVFVCRPSIAESSFEQIRAQVRSLLSRLSAHKPPSREKHK